MGALIARNTTQSSLDAALGSDEVKYTMRFASTIFYKFLVDDGAKKPLGNTARMPFIYQHLAVMPDVHVGA